MSSHHFVKEGQEPALYIHEAMSFSQVESLLEWAPQVITRSSQVERVINWGIKVDVVLMEAHDSQIDELLKSQIPVRTVTVSTGSELVSTVRGVLDSNHQTNITIVCSDASALLDEWRPASGKDTVTLLDFENRWLGIGHHSFSKWFPAGTRLLLSPGRGTYRINDGERNDNGLITLRDGMISIHSPDFFWVGEFL
jgi:hypothetical protein